MSKFQTPKFQERQNCNRPEASQHLVASKNAGNFMIGKQDKVGNPTAVQQLCCNPSDFFNPE
jgi:hypothetical protein